MCHTRAARKTFYDVIVKKKKKRSGGERARHTEEGDARSDCDVELERRLDVVIGGDTLVLAAVPKPHRSPDCEAASSDLHAVRQRLAVSVNAPKEESRACVQASGAGKSLFVISSV